MLQQIFDKLRQAPLLNTTELANEQKYLRLALDDESRASLQLLAAEFEQTAIYAYLQALDDADRAPLERKSQCLVRLQQFENIMRKAEQISEIAAFTDDHRLRGNLYFLQNHDHKQQ